MPFGHTLTPDAIGPGPGVIRGLCQQLFRATVPPDAARTLWEACSGHLRELGLSSSVKAALEAGAREMDHMVRQDVLGALAQVLLADESVPPQADDARWDAFVRRSRLALVYRGADLGEMPPVIVERTRTLGL